MRIVVEAFNLDKRGSESGIGLAWVIALCRQFGPQAVTALVSPFANAEILASIGVKAHVIEFRAPLEWFISKSRNVPVLGSYIDAIGHRIRYLMWLRDASVFAKTCLQIGPEDICVHATWTSLLLGTKLRNLSSGAQCVIAGSLPGRVSKGFRDYLNLSEILADFFHPVIIAYAARHLSGCSIGTSNLATERALSQYRKNSKLKIEPFPDLILTDKSDLHSSSSRTQKHRRLIFVDTPGMPRKGRVVLKTCLEFADQNRFQIPLMILSTDQAFWKAVSGARVEVIQWLSEADFSALLGGSKFILSCSWREGTPTSIVRAMLLGVVPVIPETDTFGYLPDSCLRYSCETDAAKGLSDALTRANSISDSDWQTMSDRSHSWAKTTFSNGEIDQRVRKLLYLS